MKKISLILLSLSILLCACKRECPAYPTDQIASVYAPFKYGGSILTYRSTDGLSILEFKCGVPFFSEYNKQPYCAKCACEISAEQILQSESETITYSHIIENANPKSQAGLYIVGTIGDIPLRVGIYWIDYEHLPEWTSAGGTHYTEVYHLLYEASATSLYLAPEYGIVQIETPDKTYYLQHENK